MVVTYLHFRILVHSHWYSKLAMQIPNPCRMLGSVHASNHSTVPNCPMNGMQPLPGPGTVCFPWHAVAWTCNAEVAEQFYRFRWLLPRSSLPSRAMVAYQLHPGTIAALLIRKLDGHLPNFARRKCHPPQLSSQSLGNWSWLSLTIGDVPSKPGVNMSHSGVNGQGEKTSSWIITANQYGDVNPVCINP